MISYAQNAEDVVLARAFADQPWGFYIDVGANHPDWDSVTKHFYDRGWRGINIEPMSREHQLLTDARPGDVNLRVALGERAGTATLHETPLTNRGSSTILPDLAAAYERAGDHITPVEVEVTTLTDVCERWVPGPIDFIKVDVEGYEAEVVRGGDWTRFQPRVVVIEAVAPVTHEPTHDEWEPALLEAGYEYVLFDGLNRFYVHRDASELRDRVAVPANVLDRYVTLTQASERAAVRAHLETLRRALAALQESLSEDDAKPLPIAEEGPPTSIT